MNSNSDYLKKVFNLFWKSFLPLFLCFSFLAQIIFQAQAGSFLIGFIPSFFISLFISFHLTRQLSTETFEINSSNKNPQLGLRFYQEEIENFLLSLRYEKIISNDQIIFSPTRRGQLMGGNITLSITPYELSLTGPKGIIRLLKSSLDLVKIF